MTEYIIIRLALWGDPVAAIAVLSSSVGQRSYSALWKTAGAMAKEPFAGEDGTWSI